MYCRCYSKGLKGDGVEITSFVTDFFKLTTPLNSYRKVYGIAVNISWCKYP
jgi:hypothetical protein